MQRQFRFVNYQRPDFHVTQLSLIVSGFDYIRKKKRPAPNASENPLSVNNIIKKRLAAMENLENKDESDIRKEIKGWVLNKGVGESVLHKASRLDYVVCVRFYAMQWDVGRGGGEVADGSAKAGSR